MLAELPQSLPVLTGRALAWVERRRMPIFAASALSVAVSIAIAFAVRSSGDVALFDAPLHPSQAQEIETALTLWGEANSSDAAGTQVYVPSSRRRDVLLRLTLAGVPRPYVPTTADILAEPTSPLAPGALLDDRRRVGIEGDLIATLRRIAGVADANVMLTPTGDDPFTMGARAQPSAAVQLVMQPNARPPARVVDGIRRLVAAAVDGLNPERVTVTDSEGVLLDGAPPQDRAASREARLQGSVQSALDAVLGAGASVVRVRVVAAGVDVSVLSTRVTPHGLLDADIGREHGREAARAFDKERHVQHYAYDTDVERRTTAADSVKRISVAVFLDARRIDASRRDDVAALVRAAAGADLGTGDSVVVAMLPFVARVTPAQSMPAAPSSSSRPSLVRMVVPAAAVGALALAVFFWPRRSAILPQPPAVERDAATSVSATIDAELPRTAAYVLSGLPPGLRARVLREFDPMRRSAIEACFEEWSDV